MKGRAAKPVHVYRAAFDSMMSNTLGGVEQGELAASPPFREMPAQCVACTRLSQPTRSWQVYRTLSKDQNYMGVEEFLISMVIRSLNSSSIYRLNL